MSAAANVVMPTQQSARVRVSINRSALVMLIGLMLVFLVSRVSIWQSLEFEIDEVWTIRQTIGTPAQVILWTPYDWPALHYLSLHYWQELTGIHPFAVRLFSVYIGLIGLATLYRLARRWFGVTAALLAVAAFGAFGYMIYLTTLIRGYIILVSLFPLALLLTENYFRRPGWRRAIPLAICMAVMFYTHLTSVVMFAVIGIYSLVVFPRQLWRWWLPGMMAGALALPEVISKTQLAIIRTNVTQQIQLAPFFEAVGGVYRDMFGTGAAVWAVVTVIALIMALATSKRRIVVVMLIVWCAGPLLMYVLNPLLGFFNVRHQSWVLIGLALLIGLGVSKLPRLAHVAFIGLCCVSMFLPMPAYRMYLANSPFMATFPWLTTHVRAGDVFYIDPNCVTGAPEEWDYFTRVYFPEGLPIVDDPTGYRRVWYVSIDGKQDDTAKQRINDGRIAREFIGPWNFLIRLYEGPPEPHGALFSNGMRFLGAEQITDISPRAYLEGETVTIRLWWSVDSPPPLDYSIALQMQDSKGNVIRSQDSPPMPVDAPQETSRWVTGRFYIEDRQITLPDSILTGAYPVYLAVYHFTDPTTRLTADGVNADGLLKITTIKIKSW